MDKPRFSLDDLQVQTFETTTSPRHHPAATVRGQTEYPIEETAYNDPNCNPYYTQGSSCQQGGGETCDCGGPQWTDQCAGWFTNECAFSEAHSPCGTGHCGSTSFCTQGQNTCAGITCGGATCPAGSCP